jgi:hypothetical protein
MTDAMNDGSMDHPDKNSSLNYSLRHLKSSGSARSALTKKRSRRDPR